MSTWSFGYKGKEGSNLKGQDLVLVSWVRPEVFLPMPGECASQLVELFIWLLISPPAAGFNLDIFEAGTCLPEGPISW